MTENDLEQGSLSPSFTPRKGSFGTAVSNSLESAAFLGNAKATNGPIGSTLSDCFYEAENDSIIGVPRRKVEQLMRLWVDVFQQSLKQVDDKNPETPQSTAIPTRQSPEPKLLNTRKSSPSPNISDYLSGIPSLTNINVMSDVEIEVENNSRRSVRDQWRSDEKAIHLEDCWKHIWEPKPGVDRGLFQWSCPEEKRKALQLDLIDALNGQSDDLTVALYMRKDFRSIATWVSLVGLRLNEIYRSFYGSPQITPAIQIEILIECLWACNQFRPVLGVRQDLQGPTVGDVLSSCYRRRVLEHPSPNQLLGSLILRQHYQYIYTAVYLINILYAHRLPQFEKTQKLSETWNMLLSRAEASLRQAPDNSELDEGKDAFFSIDDFNLKDLQYIGNLQIRWTCYWDEHLQLETNSTGNILKIYWFQPSLARYLVQNRLCTQIEYGERRQREHEICATWSIIFTSNNTERKSRRYYEKLQAPKWMSLLANSQLGTWDAEQEIRDFSETAPKLSRFMDKSLTSSYCFETRDHLLFRLSKRGSLPHERLSYSQFPAYAARLRELRAYMDAQKPKGLRALWRDRRDSNTYYTFWFVAIFGSLSVLLATCALAVSIAQTWATFHTLPSSNS